VSNLTNDAAWVLVITFALSFVYEIYRARIKAGTSKHDSMHAFVLQIPLYVAAAVVISLLFAGVGFADEAGLAFSVVAILVSIFYYNPKVMMERQPDIIDWFEDLVFTGLLFVVAALLLYEVLGRSLDRPGIPGDFIPCEDGVTIQASYEAFAVGSGAGSSAGVEHQGEHES
jgi:hypothetical protein